MAQNLDKIDEMLEDSTIPEPKIFELYWKFLSSWGKYCILVFWFIILVVGGVWGRLFLSSTNFSFAAPPGTPGHDADASMKKSFPEVANTRELLVYYKCGSVATAEQCGTIPIYDLRWPTYNISVEFNESLFKWSARHDDIVLSYADYYSTIEGQTNPLLIKFVQKLFISESNTSSIGIIRYDNTQGSNKATDASDWVTDELLSLTHEHGSVIIAKMTGEQPMISDMTAESREDVEKKDIITIPLALCVLATVVRSWRVMFIPLLCVLISVCASFSIMLPFAQHVLDVNPFAPSLMMSVTVAMSIDYSLFLLTRFREEMEKKNPDVTDAVRQTTRWSGKVVALSGFILSITYIGLAFYPMEMLQSVGIGACIAVLCTIVVNLTCTPALLLVCPNFFSQFGCTCSCKKKAPSQHYTEAIMDQHLYADRGSDTGLNFAPNKGSIQADSAAASLHTSQQSNEQPSKALLRPNNPVRSNSDVSAQEFHASKHFTGRADSMASSSQMDFDFGPQKCCMWTPKDPQFFGFELNEEEKKNPLNRCWHCCGSFTTICPWSIVITLIIYALIMPIGWRVTEIKKQLEDTLIFPRDSDYLATYKEVEADFSPGTLAPWYVEIPLPKDDSGLTSVREWNYVQDTGDLMNLFRKNLTQENYNISSVSGVSIINNNYFKNNRTYAEISKDPRYLDITASWVNDDESSSYFEVVSGFDPFYEDAIKFVARARDVLDDVCSANSTISGTQYKCYLSGGSIDEVDCVNNIFEHFAMVIGIIAATVFVIMGFFFYSCFVPIRLFLTITIPMSLVYGLSILVYQKGLLDGMKWSSVKGTDGLYWLIPVMTVTILIGLALDYDIFLFARIYEYRTHGLPTRIAIIRGVYKTGSIITAAGCIMAIAFCGLLLSNITCLNQTGFILVVAVLVDTFIIRTALVPAILSMAREVNWWPGINDCTRQRTYSIQMDSRRYNEPTLDEEM